MTRYVFHTCIVILTLCVVSIQSMAQCVPDANSGGLYSPSQDEGIPDGAIGLNYEAIITVNVPSDTVIFGIAGDLDSAVLTNVSGLPPGFQYECVPASCGFPGGEQGCILLTGFTDDEANAGDWVIEGSFTFHAQQGPVPVTFPFTEELYTLTLNTIPASVSEVDVESLRFSIGPNPVNKYSTLTYDLPASGAVKVVVYNLVGRSVYKEGIDGRKGENLLRMNGMSLDAGIYFLELSQGNYTRSARFIIQE